MINPQIIGLIEYASNVINVNNALIAAGISSAVGVYIFIRRHRHIAE